MMRRGVGIGLVLFEAVPILENSAAIQTLVANCLNLACFSRVAVFVDSSTIGQLYPMSIG